MNRVVSPPAAGVFQTNLHFSGVFILSQVPRGTVVRLAELTAGQKAKAGEGERSGDLLWV